MELLAERPVSVGVLADGLPISRPAVSQHLRVLKEAGLVAETVSGTRRIYHIDQTGLAALRDYLDTFWRTTLDNFASLAESEAAQDHRPSGEVPG